MLSHLSVRSWRHVAVSLLDLKLAVGLVSAGKLQSCFDDLLQFQKALPVLAADMLLCLDELVVANKEINILTSFLGVGDNLAIRRFTTITGIIFAHINKIDALRK